MSKGYIMIASGEEHIQQAYLCAKSIKQTQTIKNVSLLYNEAEGKETVLSVVMKGVIIAVVFLVLKLFIK